MRCVRRKFIFDYTILLVTIISMVFPRNCVVLILHCVARAKILASQMRINPVSHPREQRLPLPVSNESLRRCNGCIATPSLCSINLTFRESARLLLPLRLYASVPDVYDRCALVYERNSKLSGSGRLRFLVGRRRG